MVDNSTALAAFSELVLRVVLWGACTGACGVAILPLVAGLWVQISEPNPNVRKVSGSAVRAYLQGWQFWSMIGLAVVLGLCQAVI
jgi:hypothetical protein